MTIARVWPGITPLNVHDLEHRVWRALALSCDDVIESEKKQAAEIAAARSRAKR